jgi:hypothetical protein
MKISFDAKLTSMTSAIGDLTSMKKCFGRDATFM